MLLDHSLDGNEFCAALFELWRERGTDPYEGSSVTHLEHALQTATLAEQASAPPALVVAALLHDFAHLYENDLPPEYDLRHEVEGARRLHIWFGPEVTIPIGLHVRAKRYLLAIDPEYRQQLSDSAVRNLELQGGAMTPEEVAEFSAHPLAGQAVTLRRWDDRAKVPGRETPELEHFAPVLKQCLRKGRGRSRG